MGMSQRNLAQSPGVNPGTLQAWEAGQHEPTGKNGQLIIPPSVRSKGPGRANGTHGQLTGHDIGHVRGLIRSGAHGAVFLPSLHWWSGFEHTLKRMLGDKPNTPRKRLDIAYCFVCSFVLQGSVRRQARFTDQIRRVLPVEHVKAGCLECPFKTRLALGEVEMETRKAH
jgi:hypothetical protein